MSFPASPITDENKEKFLIQDSFGLRHAIQPVVSISNIEDKITGLGTCFQVSPWSWLTAEHVVKDKNGTPFPINEVGAVGFSPGLIYGSVEFVTTDYFGDICGIYNFTSADRKTPAIIPGPKPPEIEIDVAKLNVNVNSLKEKHTVSPLAISMQSPNIGDELMGIGYPILGSSHTGNEAPMRFEEAMYGAAGKVVALHPEGVSSTFPWPTIEIEGDWEGGMSGGPVINTQGHIIGLISRSLAPAGGAPGVGYAVSFSQIPLNQLVPELNLSNPGYVYGWGVFKSEELVSFMPDEATALASKAERSADSVAVISFDAKTGYWMKV